MGDLPLTVGKQGVEARHITLTTARHQKTFDARDLTLIVAKRRSRMKRSQTMKILATFTARDNPKVKEVKTEEILDDSVMKELDDSGFVKILG